MTKQISILILASAALHAAMLGLIDFNSPIDVPLGTQMRISIQAPALKPTPRSQTTKQDKPLIEKESIKPTVIAKIKPTQFKSSKDISNKEVVKNKSSAEIENKIDNKVVTTSSIKAVTPPNDTPLKASLPAQASSLLHADLERAFALHFYYPRLAIKRGWQGEVHISLRVEPNGQLSDIRILRGSGYSLLDKSAMQSINKVEILPAAIALLDGNSLDLILPVEYHLL
ncbi:MAG: energy transducer TonB [Sulfuriflexus sp.]|nr:energy transducer TonB [Sulfuriflexus sp.]